jgi:signal transduction histidine kinase
MRSGEPELYAEIPNAFEAGWVRDVVIVGGLGLRSAMVVPMHSRTGVLGVITLASSEPGRYGIEDLAIAEEIGRRAGSAIEKARLYDAAQRAVTLRDEFLSIASHELRTPLTALHLQLQSAYRRGSAPADITRKIESAIRSSERLGTLIETLLDVSRITTGRFKLEKERFDAATAARDVVETFHESANRAGCELTVHTEVAANGEWDKLRVEQALGNLLANAIKYAAGKPIEVRVSTERGHVIVTISDGGAGILESDLTRIFERFERADSARHLGGLGLGLYVGRQIAEAHGGTLEAANLPAGGARFTLRLPLGSPTEG